MLKFSEVKALKNGAKKIFVRSGEGEPLRIVTEKCLSYGVKKSEKYNTKTISVVLGENSRKELEAVIEKCGGHLEKPLSKVLYEREDGSATIYPKIREYEEYRSVFYGENSSEIDPMKFEGKHCEIKCVLEIEGIIIGEEEKASLQLRVYEAMVRKKVYEHKRILNMKW